MSDNSEQTKKQLENNAQKELKQKQEEQRDLVKKEILETEQDYNNDLRALYSFLLNISIQHNNDDKVKAFVGPMINDIQLMIKISDKFLEQLKKSDTLISTALTTLATAINEKATYDHYPLQQKKLEKLWKSLMKNKKIMKLGNEFKDANAKLDISNYLMKPVQRMTKYPLLIRELLKNTENTDPNKPVITKSLETMQVALLRINNKKNLKKFKKAHAKTEIKKARSVAFSSDKNKFFKMSFINAKALKNSLNDIENLTEISISENKSKRGYTVTATIKDYNNKGAAKQFKFSILNGTPGVNTKGKDTSDTFHIQLDTAITNESERKIVYDLMEKIGKSVIATLQMPVSGTKPVNYEIANPLEETKKYQFYPKKSAPLPPSKQTATTASASQPITFLQELKTAQEKRKNRSLITAAPTYTPQNQPKKH